MIAVSFLGRVESNPQLPSIFVKQSTMALIGLSSTSAESICCQSAQINAVSICSSGYQLDYMPTTSIVNHPSKSSPVSAKRTDNEQSILNLKIHHSEVVRAAAFKLSSSGFESSMGFSFLLML